MEIWKGVTHASLTDSERKDRATQLLTKYKSGALVTQLLLFLTQLEFRGAGQGMGGQWSAAAQVDLGKIFSLFRNTIF